VGSSAMEASGLVAACDALSIGMVHPFGGLTANP
jgi:hypothetical protein